MRKQQVLHHVGGDEDAQHGDPPHENGPEPERLPPAGEYPDDAHCASHSRSSVSECGCCPTGKGISRRHSCTATTSSSGWRSFQARASSFSVGTSPKST